MLLCWLKIETGRMIPGNAKPSRVPGWGSWHRWVPRGYFECFRVHWFLQGLLTGAPLEKSTRSIYSNIFLTQYSITAVGVCVCLVTQSCPTPGDPMNCNSPGSSVHGIFLARILEWVAIPSSRGSFQPRDWTWLSCIEGRFFTTEPLGNPYCRYRFGNNAAISC